MWEGAGRADAVTGNCDRTGKSGGAFRLLLSQSKFQRATTINNAGYCGNNCSEQKREREREYVFWAGCLEESDQTSTLYLLSAIISFDVRLLFDA